MRRASTPSPEPTSTSRRAFGAAAAIGLALALFLLAGPAPAETEIQPEGRRIGTDGKLTQSALDGYPIETGDVATRRKPGRVLTPEGRRLRAVPTEDYSVGLIGCPGCTAILEALGGIWVEVEGRRGRPAARPE